MSSDAVIYIELHHPLQLKFPAQPVPDGATLEDFRRCLFDERIDKSTLHTHQQFYSDLFNTFRQLLDKGYKLSIGVSATFLRYILQLASPTTHDDSIFPRLDEFISQLQLEQMPWGFDGLMLHPQVEVICIEPYSSLSFYLDIEVFIQKNEFFKKCLEESLQKKLSAAATIDLCMNNSIYKSFADLQFNNVIMEGAEWVLEGRKPSYLCKVNDRGPLLCLRHNPLSILTTKILSDPSSPKITSQMKSIARQIKEASGDFVLLGWDINTPRAYDKQSGLVSTLSQLCEELDSLGVNFSTVSEVAMKFSSRARRLTLPAFTSNRIEGGMEYLLNSETQQWIFQLMHHAYNMAKLSKNEDLIDIALWLAQIDNLKLAASFSSGLKPDCYRSSYWEWLSPDELLQELGRVYANFIKAARYYI